MPDRTLRGLRILVTRAAADAKLIGEPLRQLGAEVSYLPLFDIVPIEPTSGQLAALSRYAPTEHIIFISRNAVRYSLPYLKQQITGWPQSPRMFAVGEGTADLLSSQTQQSVIYPPRLQTSEGLLGLKQLQQVHGQRIWIMKGHGGRQLLEKTLTSRGAVLNSFAWYRRQTWENTGKSLEILLKNNKFDIILLSSSAAIKRFEQLISELPEVQLSQLNLLVVSQRLAQEASSTLPQAKILCAKGAGQQAVTQAMLQWVDSKKI
jgi:uroporphyrinogen-III synthase